jgi:hypothetical protein
MRRPTERLQNLVTKRFQFKPYELLKNVTRKTTRVSNLAAEPARADAD